MVAIVAARHSSHRLPGKVLRPLHGRPLLAHALVRLQSVDRLDDIVRRKIASLSRNVPPGSREWDVLYQRYLEEERRKQKS